MAQFDKKDFQRRLQKIEELVQAIESSADPRVRATAVELTQSLMELHRSGIDRMMEIVFDTGTAGGEIIDRFAEDDLAASLLLLYGLHPLDIDTRVMQALDKVRPYLRSHGGNVELVGVSDSVVRLRLQGSCNGCASSAMTLKLAIEEAIYEAAPDVMELEVEGVIGESPRSSLVQLERSPAKNGGPPAMADAVERLGVAGMAAPANGAVEIKDLGSRCELCGGELVEEHHHLIEPASRKLTCACGPCAILFTGQDGKYRRVPQRIRALPDFQLTDEQWESLMIPINMAFFFYSSTAGRIVAYYPSPGGATESLLAFETWEEIVERNPALREMEPDVEALLVNRIGKERNDGEAEYFLAPIDKCYELTGLIRARWRGLSGGAEVWEEIERFFAGLKGSSTMVKEASRA